MDNTISKGLRNLFLVHAIVSAVLGVALYVIPGRVLIWLGWYTKEVVVTVGSTSVTASSTLLVDPIISRLVGAVLLALGFASFLGWQAKRRQDVSILIQLDFVYCVLGLVAFLVRVAAVSLSAVPAIWWVMMALLLAFAVAWGLSLRR